MSIENITGKILAEARDQSEQVLEEARNKSQTIAEKAAEQTEKIKKDFHEQATEDAQLLKSRRTSVAELEVRKMRLGAKQALIFRSFDVALEQLTLMKEEDYIEFLSSAILETGVVDGELLLNRKDRESLGEKLVGKFNSMAKGGDLTLAEDTIDARGGFVLRKGAVEINSTLETMVNGIRESATPDVVKALFG